MATARGPLGTKWSRWMSAHAHEIVDDIPLPQYRWRWEQVAVDRSNLTKLKDAGLIRRDPAGRWRTTQECIDAIAAYGRYDPGRVGCHRGQVVFGCME